ncbi:MAG: hypothetical protein MJ058_03040 [Akkermansia sp.]|nr:hypothetical protein [Akkermansia sp.]
MMMKSLMACACAVMPLCRAAEAAPDVAPQSAVGMTFTFSPATEEQTTARATAKGDIPHPVHNSNYRHAPVTVPEKPAPPNRCTYTKTGPNTARITCSGPESVMICLTFEAPESGTCTITKSMPGASRSYGGVRFTVKQR